MYHLDIVDNLKQPLALVDGEQLSTHGDGLPAATNVATPIVDFEDVPSPSFDSIVTNFAMHTTINSPTLESFIR